MATYRVDSDSVERVAVAGEMLAFDRRNGKYLSLNSTAAELWPQLERGSTLEELQLALTARWDVDDERARSDVVDLLSWLRDADMLADSPPSDS